MGRPAQKLFFFFTFFRKAKFYVFLCFGVNFGWLLGGKIGETIDLGNVFFDVVF